MLALAQVTRSDPLIASNRRTLSGRCSGRIQGSAVCRGLPGCGRDTSLFARQRETRSSACWRTTSSRSAASWSATQRALLSPVCNLAPPGLRAKADGDAVRLIERLGVLSSLVLFFRAPRGATAGSALGELLIGKGFVMRLFREARWAMSRLASSVRWGEPQPGLVYGVGAAAFAFAIAWYFVVAPALVVHDFSALEAGESADHVFAGPVEVIEVKPGGVYRVRVKWTGEVFDVGPDERHLLTESML